MSRHVPFLEKRSRASGHRTSIGKFLPVLLRGREGEHAVVVKLVPKLRLECTACADFPWFRGGLLLGTSLHFDSSQRGHRRQAGNASCISLLEPVLGNMVYVFQAISAALWRNSFLVVCFRCRASLAVALVRGL